MGEKGFTLIEVMIALLVMAGVLVSVLTANTAVSRVSEKFYQRLFAIQDANQVIERMRNTAATGTFPGNVTAAYPNGGAVAGFNSIPGEAVTVSYANTAANPLDVTVTVNYLENGSVAESTTLRSLITKRA